MSGTTGAQVEGMCGDAILFSKQTALSLKDYGGALVGKLLDITTMNSVGDSRQILLRCLME